MKSLPISSLFATLLLVGCSSEKDVSSADFGDAWPLTVESGAVKCVSPNAAVFIHEGKEYQLNGAASSKGYRKINRIWADNPQIPGTKKDIGPLLKAALDLC